MLLHRITQEMCIRDRNYETIEILRYYYGDNMFINTAEEISGIPASWPRYNLEVGAAGDKVRQIQEQLARISQAYPAIPTITPDGIYGEEMCIRDRISPVVFPLLIR